MENKFNPLILNKIFSNLSLNDLKSCSLVDKRFNRAFNVDLLWSHLCKREYDEKVGKMFGTLCAKEGFKKYTMLVYVKEKLELKMEIDQLLSLQNLDLSYNELKEIPKEIGQLASLRYLCLSHNQLKEIPDEIKRLPNLSIKFDYYNTNFINVFESKIDIAMKK